MSRKSDQPVDANLQEHLQKGGLRMTPQRQHVFEVLLEKRDHPTAEEVFIRAKNGMPEISMATVYNCLDALVSCGLVRQVNQDRTATRYCSNMRKHHHFYCEECGGAYDIDLVPSAPPIEVPLPKGFKPTQFEVNVRGICPECAGKMKKQPA
jgi:Fur family peroxide stress response transcriptional regulator